MEIIIGLLCIRFFNSFLRKDTFLMLKRNRGDDLIKELLKKVLSILNVKYIQA